MLTRNKEVGHFKRLEWPVSILSERVERHGRDATTEIELKSLILAQIERWRHALHMQVERALGLAPKLVANG
jgi:hypothetical protein